MRSSKVLQVLFFVSIGVCKTAFGADSDDPIVGEWKWFTRDTMVIHADGRLTKSAADGSSKPMATWRRLNPGEAPCRYEVTWPKIKAIDILLLENEETRLSGVGKNKYGDHVSAQRMSHEDPEKAAAAPAAGSPAPNTANAPTPSAPPAWNPSLLTAPLEPYIRNLPGLLSLRRTGNKETRELLEQASGTLIVMRQGFVVKREKATTQNVAAFDAALRTCDLLSAALAERTKVLGNLQASGAVVNDGRLEEQARKDNLTQGIRGDGLAKAVGSIVERDREKEANAKAAARAKHSDQALTAMAENQWNQRSAQLMGQIAAAYGEIK